MAERKMKMKMNRIISCILAAMLVSVSVTGCGNKSTPSGSGSDSTTGTDASSDSSTGVVEVDPNKKYDISFYSYWCGEVVEGNYCEKLIEDAMGNIDIHVTKVANNNQEQLNLMLASGEMPDVAWLDKSPSYMKDQELSRTIPVEMVKKYAPSFIKLCDDNPVLYAEALNKEDPSQFDYLPGFGDTATRIYTPADFYRYDWMLALGIDPGVEVEQLSDQVYVAKTGISKDKFKEILEAFTFKDPDGNGKNDTMGMSVTAATHNSRDLFFSGFKFIAKDSNNVDGKATMWYSHPEYKNYLKYFQDLYKSGVADKEWMTQKRDACWEKANSGIAGYWHQSTIALNQWAIDRPPLTLMEKNPDAKVLMTPGLLADDGRLYMQKPASAVGGYCYVNANLTDEAKLARALEFLEYSNFGPDKYNLWFGKEGVNWAMEDGKAVVKEAIPNGAEGTKIFNQFMQTGDLWEAITMEPIFTKGAKYYDAQSDGIWNKDCQYAYKYDLRGETDYSEIIVEVSSDLNSYVETYYMDCILGKNDIDATWDEYLANLDRYGANRLMAELDKLPPVVDIIAEYSK